MQDKLWTSYIRKRFHIFIYRTIGHTHIELFVLFLYIFIFPAKHVKDNRYRMQYNIFFSSPEYKNPTKCVSLVQIGHCCHPMECNLFSPWYSWKIAHLTLNSNHSILWLIIFASEGLRFGSPFSPPLADLEYILRIRTLIFHWLRLPVHVSNQKTFYTEHMLSTKCKQKWHRNALIWQRFATSVLVPMKTSFPSAKALKLSLS